MVEVFKTNVIDIQDAQKIIDRIHEVFSNCIVNFDLEDCDKILRVKCLNGFISCEGIIAIVSQNGFNAVVLPDDFQPTVGMNFNTPALKILSLI